MIVHIPIRYSPFGSRIPIGLNGRVSYVPAGVDYDASDTELASLQGLGIKIERASVPAGFIMLPSSIYGLRVPNSINGQQQFLSAGIPIQPSADQLAVIQAAGLFYVSGAGNTPTPTPSDPALSAPVLALGNGPSSFPPQLKAAFDASPQSGMTIRLQLSSDIAFTTPVSATHVITDADINAGGFSWGATLSALTSPVVRYFREQVESVIGTGPWSNIVMHGDAVAPTITSGAAIAGYQGLAGTFALGANKSVIWKIVGGYDKDEFAISGGSLSYQFQAGAGTRVVQVQALSYAGVASATQTLTLTLAANTPTALAFNNITGATRSTAYTSNTVTVAGLLSGTGAAISVSGGTYSKNGGAFTAAEGVVANGDTLALRVTTASSYATPTLATLAAGSTTASYQAMTLVDPAPALPQPSAVKLWLEARDSTTVFQNIAGSTPATAAGQSLGLWKDKSTNAFDLSTVADDTSRPTLGNSGTVWWANFDGVNDVMRRLSDLSIGTNSGFTMAIALRSQSNAAGAILFGSGSTSAVAPRTQPVRASAGSATAGSVFFSSDASSTSGGTAYDAPFDGTDHVIVVNDTGGNFDAYVDGTAYTGLAGRGSSVLTLNSVSLGAFLSTTITSYFAARVYGLVVWPSVTLSAAERGQLLSYMLTLQGRSL